MPNTNLNPKEEKQEEPTINPDLPGKNVSGVVHLWGDFSGGQFSWEPIVRRATMKATDHPKGNFLWGQLSREKLIFNFNLIALFYVGTVQ